MQEGGTGGKGGYNGVGGGGVAGKGRYEWKICRPDGGEGGLMLGVGVGGQYCRWIQTTSASCYKPLDKGTEYVTTCVHNSIKPKKPRALTGEIKVSEKPLIFSLFVTSICSGSL